MKLSQKTRIRLFKIRDYTYITLVALFIIVTTVLQFGGPDEVIIGGFIFIFILLAVIPAMTILSRRRCRK